MHAIPRFLRGIEGGNWIIKASETRASVKVEGRNTLTLLLALVIDF